VIFCSTEGSWCYDDDLVQCERFGRLYNWNTARSACPNGWKLPSLKDFEGLLSYAGGEGKPAYQALVDGGSSKFYAIFGGLRLTDGEFMDLDSVGFWWSSTEYGSANAGFLNMSISGQQAMTHIGDKNIGFSIRCIKE
jgi:uncharacterized protein (TIGR02145 family)